MLTQLIFHFTQRHNKVEVAQTVFGKYCIYNKVCSKRISETSGSAKCPQIVERTNALAVNAEDDASFIDVRDLAPVPRQLADTVQKRLASHEATRLVARQCHLPQVADFDQCCLQQLDVQLRNQMLLTSIDRSRSGLLLREWAIFKLDVWSRHWHADCPSWHTHKTHGASLAGNFLAVPTNSSSSSMCSKIHNNNNK